MIQIAKLKFDFKSLKIPPHQTRQTSIHQTQKYKGESHREPFGPFYLQSKVGKSSNRKRPPPPRDHPYGHAPSAINYFQTAKHCSPLLVPLTEKYLTWNRLQFFGSQTSCHISLVGPGTGSSRGEGGWYEKVQTTWVEWRENTFRQLGNFDSSFPPFSTPVSFRVCVKVEHHSKKG